MSENLKPLINELGKQGIYPFLCHNCNRTLISNGEEVVQCPSCNALNQVPEETLINLKLYNENNKMNEINNNNNYQPCNNCNNNTITIEGDDYYNQTVAICPFCNYSNKIDFDTNKVICFQCNNVFNVNGYTDYLYNNLPNYPVQPITVRTIRKVPIQTINYDNSCNNNNNDNYLINEIIEKLEVKKPPIRYYQLSDINLARDLDELEQRRFIRYKIMNEERYYPKYHNNRFRKVKYKKKHYEKRDSKPVTINVNLKEEDNINIKDEDYKNNEKNEYHTKTITFDKISNSNRNYNNDDNKYKSFSFSTDNNNNNPFDKTNINLNITRQRKSFSEYANPIINNSYSFKKDKHYSCKYNNCWSHDSYLNSLNNEIRNDPNFKNTLTPYSDTHFNSDFNIKKQYSSKNLMDNLHHSMNLHKELKTYKSYTKFLLNTPEKKDKSNINYKLFGGLEFK